MIKLRCLAIDDEPFALEILADDIQKVPFLELAGQHTSPLTAYEQLHDQPIDLLFLDIQMPNGIGTQFLRTLDQPPMVIFTTAYEQYALEGYELAAVDYLLKPVPFGRFLRAVNKAYDLHQLRQPCNKGAVKDGQSDSNSAERGYFLILVEYRKVKLFFDEILYIEGLKDYVKIFTTQQMKPFLSQITLKGIAERLPSDSFFRVHKSFIVAFDKISSFQRSNLLIGQQKIPIGISYLATFEHQYRGNR